MGASTNRAHLDEMLAAYGSTEGRTCGECAHCVNKGRPGGGRAMVSFFVCLKAATRTNGHNEMRRRPWRRAWPACGQFQASEAVR